jgi:hypothetical protein
MSDDFMFFSVLTGRTIGLRARPERRIFYHLIANDPTGAARVIGQKEWPADERGFSPQYVENGRSRYTPGT